MDSCGPQLRYARKRKEGLLVKTMQWQLKNCVLISGRGKENKWRESQDRTETKKREIETNDKT